MRIQKILFATDFSDCSRSALEYASRLASDSGARLLIVHVEEIAQQHGEGMLYAGVPQEDPSKLKEQLQTVLPTAPDVRHEHHLLSGTPSSEIARLAEAEQVDMIVMGTHGRTGLRRLLMGSVAENVLRKAECPVLVVKPPRAAPDESA